MNKLKIELLGISVEGDSKTIRAEFHCEGLKPRDRGRDLVSEPGGELKLTKSLKKVIFTSFVKEKMTVQSLAALYEFSPGQIENTIREAVMDQQSAAELFAQRRADCSKRIRG